MAFHLFLKLSTTVPLVPCFGFGNIILYLKMITQSCRHCFLTTTQSWCCIMIMTRYDRVIVLCFVLLCCLAWKMADSFKNNLDDASLIGSFRMKNWQKFVCLCYCYKYWPLEIKPQKIWWLKMNGGLPTEIWTLN